MSSAITPETLKPCRRGDIYCGNCYTCGGCRAERQRAAYDRLSPAERAYDAHVDPLGAHSGPGPHRWPHEVDGGLGCCSCHISAPCAWCVEQTEEEGEEQ